MATFICISEAGATIISYTRSRNEGFYSHHFSLHKKINGLGLQLDAFKKKLIYHDKYVAEGKNEKRELILIYALENGSLKVESYRLEF